MLAERHSLTEHSVASHRLSDSYTEHRHIHVGVDGVPEQTNWYRLTELREFLQMDAYP